MAWIILGIAVITEIAWALSMKLATTQGSWTSASVPIILNFVNMGLLAFAMRTLPAGTAYAVWTGLGAAGVAVIAAAGAGVAVAVRRRNRVERDEVLPEAVLEPESTPIADAAEAYLADSQSVVEAESSRS